MRSRKLFWLIPLALLLLAGGTILALPNIVSSRAHRATIEALASSLTGRQVHIAGGLTLAIFPQPQFIAQGITIGGPNAETITAKSLTLDISLAALLHGRLSATSLTLQSPDINFPWPFPGGAAAVAPPPWLTALHAQINNGAISIGALRFSNVAADIFTGADGALSVSGTGTLLGQPVTVSLGLGTVSATGNAPLTLDIQAAGADAHISGTFSAASAYTGTVSLSTGALPGPTPALSQPVSASGQLAIGAGQFALTGMQINQGPATLSGGATLDFSTDTLNLDFSGSNLSLPAVLPAGNFSFLQSLGSLAIKLALDESNPGIGGISFPHLQVSAAITQAGLSIAALNATLPGDGSFTGSGNIGAAGDIQGKAAVTANDLNALLATAGRAANLPAAWRQASLTTTISGGLNRLTFGKLSGTLGIARFAGAAVLNRDSGPASLSGALHFDQLDLTPLGGAISQFAGSDTIGGDLEITADRATLYQVPMTHLLIDAGLDGQLVVRRLSASLYNGRLAASFTMAPSGQVSTARVLLSIPSAVPLAGLLPAAWQPPASIAAQPLAFSLLAAGPPQALATGLTLSLGDIGITASPVLDLNHRSAAGAFTLRHPSAILLFKMLGLNSSLAWPGAGSVSLRADMLLSATQMGLPDFVLSMGDLTADGRLLVSPAGVIDGEIDADTLALPPMPADLSPLWGALGAVSGKISLSANRVLLAGDQILGPAAGDIALAPGKASFTLTRAALGGGNLAGTLDAAISPSAPPALTGKFALTGADTSTLNLPVTFPLTLPTGTMGAAGSLSATGYAPSAWAATLSGTASITAQNGSLSGFGLAALGTALQSTKRMAALRDACMEGVTNFTGLSVTGAFNNGIFILNSASLQSPAGTAAATGNIDMPDQVLALKFSLLPAVPNPPALGLTILGNWASPKLIPAIKPGLTWIAQP